jgi:hypothetical protein
MIKSLYHHTKKLKAPRPINKKMWGVVSRDGWLQTRSLSNTKKMSIEQLCAEGETWGSYKDVGFRIYRVDVKVVFTVKNKTK